MRGLGLRSRELSGFRRLLSTPRPGSRVRRSFRGGEVRWARPGSARSHALSADAAPSAGGREMGRTQGTPATTEMNPGSQTADRALQGSISMKGEECAGPGGGQ